MTKPDSSVQVARISAMQAVWVALITALSGIAAGWFARSPSPSSTAPPPVAAVQRWLVVQGVDGPHGWMTRVTVQVNGVPYAYPADVAYTQIGQGMAEQKLPLPIADSYAVSMVSESKRPDDQRIVLARSREVPTFKATELPRDVQRYRVQFVNDAGEKTSDSMTILYRFAD